MLSLEVAYKAVTANSSYVSEVISILPVLLIWQDQKYTLKNTLFEYRFQSFKLLYRRWPIPHRC